MILYIVVKGAYTGWIFNMKFSCLISCFYKDPVGYLKEALQSICDQTLLPDEVVLVEDGPLTADIDKVLAEYETKLPLVRLKLKENKGLGFALMHGLLQCKHDIVVRMDTDDICAPERFQRQIEFLSEHPEIDIVGTWAKDINEKGEIIGERTYPTEHSKLYKIIWACPIVHPSVTFRKQSILKVGSYDADIPRRQDYDLWIRAAIGGLKFANIPEYLLYYRFTNQYYKKNGIGVVWEQSKIGIKGINRLGGGLFAYMAVISPILRALLPMPVVKLLYPLTKKFDPRT